MLPLVVASASFAMMCQLAHADSFTVSKVSWVGDSLRIEVQTDRPDGAELNAQLARDKTGEHTVSILKFGTVSGGRFVVDADINDEDKPLRAGRYWLTIANGYDFLPVIAVVPATIPAHKQRVAGKKKKAADNDEEGTVEQSDKGASHTKSDADEEHSDLLFEPVVNDRFQRIQGLSSAAKIVLVARHKEDVENRDEAGLAEDEAAMEELAHAGKLMIVKSGTKVEVLYLYYSNPILAEIRILEGSKKGQRGFVRFCEILGTCGN